MQFSTASILAIAGILAGTSNAAILLGNTLENNYMWIEGQSACTAKVISKAGEFPCNRKVTLNNGQTYSVNGCGGTLYILNNDGTFNSQCARVQRFTDCGVEITYRCG